MYAEGQSLKSNSLCWKAIENADGVPYQLIFGSHPGDGVYTNVGKGIRELLGISPEEFSEKAFLEIVDEIIPLSGNVPEEFRISREKFIRGEIKDYNAEVLIKMPGGEKRWIRDSSVPIIEAGTGKVVGACGILFNIDAQKMSLSLIESASKHALESDSLKGAFLRNLSHEIRTPLNAIVGFSTLLNEPDKNEIERQELTEILMHNTDHLLEIFTNIIEVSNIEAGTVKVRKSVIVLNDLLRRIYDRFRIKASEKNIILFIPPDQNNKDIRILTDGFKLFQVLTFLLDNAIKFTEKGRVELKYSINDKIIKFYVSDTGIGIPEEFHARIFSRFYQVESGSNRRFEGSGIGLSISKAYVELLGGKIWFTSQPGEGSVFYFTLPFESQEVRF